jgi:DNA gyrase/topoisomerase IV subunit B
MSSRGKKKTTMAKLTRESRLRERRLEKKARKVARKEAAVAEPGQPGELEDGEERWPAEAEISSDQ